MSRLPPYVDAPAVSAAGNARAILRLDLTAGVFALTTHEPAAELAPFVDYHWVLQWDLTGRPDHVQRVLPSSSVHLSIEPNKARITGIITKFHFEEALSGRGLTDREVDASAHFDIDVDGWRQRMLAPASPDAAAATADEMLSPIAPPPDPMVDQVAQIVNGIRDDPGLTRADAVAARYGLGLRRLQRLFTEYVGIGPKWVIRCYRLHEIAGRAASGETVDWADLAIELGYSDQPHLIREFTAVVGESPAKYARTVRPADAPPQ